MPPFHQRAFAELRPTLEGLGFSLAVEHFDHHASESVYVEYRRDEKWIRIIWDGQEGVLLAHVSRAQENVWTDVETTPGSPPAIDRDLDDERIERMRNAIERIATVSGRVAHDGSRWSNADEDRVELREYDPRWPAEFEKEAKAIRTELGPTLAYSLEHVGSTAIPGLAAKPIIDVVLVVADRARWRELVAPLERIGYSHWAENPDPNRMFFVKGMPPFGSGRTHHVHVLTGEARDDMVGFRDLLLEHPEEAQRYGEVKRQLAKQFERDRDGYTAAKADFVREILQRAPSDVGSERGMTQVRQIRIAEQRDAAAIAQGEWDTAATPGRLVGRPGEIPLAAFAAKIAELSRYGCYWVAEEGGAAIGHSFLDPMEMAGNAHVFRLNIVVHPGHTARGVGTALMTEMMRWAGGRAGLEKIELLVRASNTRAIALYRRFGFVEEGRLRARVRTEDGRFLDDLAMAWFPQRGQTKQPARDE